MCQKFNIYCAEGACCGEAVSGLWLRTRVFQGDYEFSPEILSAKLAVVVYRDAAEKIKGKKLEHLYRVPLSFCNYWDIWISFVAWLHEISYNLFLWLICVFSISSEVPKALFLPSSVQQKPSLSSHFCTLQPSLISPKISRSSFCKSKQRVTSFHWLTFPVHPTTLMFLLPFHCLAACRVITQKIAWRGTSWPRGSWMLRAQERSYRRSKAGRQISTAEKSAVARSTKKDSRPSILVGVTDSAQTHCWFCTQSGGFNADLLLTMCFRTHVDVLLGLLLGEAEEKD